MTQRMRIDVGRRTLLAKTCTKCGCLKQADEFYNQTNRATHSECRGCTDEWMSDYMYKVRTESLETATKHYQKWSADDLKRLKEMWDRGVPRREIARRLNRSYQSVRNTYFKYYQQGVSDERPTPS